MSPSLTTFLFEAANFTALAALLGWLFFNPVRDALRRYREETDSRTREAERKWQEAEAARREMDRQRGQLAEELRELREQAREAARQEAQLELEEARRQIASAREAWRREAATLEESQAARLAEAIARTGSDLLQRLLADINGPQLQQALLGAACQQLAETEGAYRDVSVESAGPLDTESLQQLAAAMRLDPASLTARVNTELLAGVRISSNRGLVDASVAGLKNFTRRQLAHRLKEVAEEPRGHE